MYEKNLRQAGHTRRFAIREAGGLWEAQMQHDDVIVQRVRYDDWHRVERTMVRFAIEISTLERSGWVAD